MTSYSRINIDRFINTLGGTIHPDNHCSFDIQASTTKNAIYPLTHYGFLRIQGTDAGQFLQGQITTDISKVNHQLGELGSYCTPKGRAISSFYLSLYNSDDYLLRMRTDIVDSTLAVFAKYIVFSKAEQHNYSDDLIAIGLSGPQVKQNLVDTFGTAPNTRGEIVTHEENRLLQLDDHGLLFECWLSLSSIEASWPALSHGLSLNSSSHWELKTITLGIAEVSENTVDMFIPQMLNYHHTGAISFTKGCYTGQEIIARMHYKGKLKRQLYRINAHEQLSAGDELYKISADKSLKVIGNAVNSAPIHMDSHSSLDTKKYEALAVLTISDVEDEQVIIVTANNKEIKLLPLPYAITTSED